MAKINLLNSFARRKITKARKRRKDKVTRILNKIRNSYLYLIITIDIDKINLPFSPTWSKLRVIGESKAFSLTIFMPVIGYFILFNDKLLEYFELSEVVMIDSVQTRHGLSESTLFKLFSLYFGFTSLSLGLIFYKVFCPKLIHEYDTDIDYIHKEIELQSSDDYIFKIKYIKKFIKKISIGRGKVKLINSFLYFYEEAIKANTKIWIPSCYKDLNCSVQANATQMDKVDSALHKFGFLDSDNEGYYDNSDIQEDEKVFISSNRSILSKVMGDYHKVMDSSIWGVRWLIFTCYITGFLFLGIPSFLMLISIILSFKKLLGY